LRHVIDHFRKQEWTAIAIDFLIVVMGVFIGIQVSNLNAARADRVSERHYLAQLRQDLKLIEAEARDQIEYENFQSRLAGEIGVVIDEPGADAERKIGVGLAQLTTRRTLRVESPTFAELQSSGNLEIISDPDLRAAIIACFFRINRLVTAIDKNNQSFIDEGFVSFIRDEGLRDYGWDSALMGAPLPASIAFAASPSDTPLTRLETVGAAVRVLDTPGLGDKIIAHLSWRGAGSAANESLAERIFKEVRALDETIAAHMDGDAP
jgi:hypothetical protein